MKKSMDVNGQEYEVLRLLGHGKGSFQQNGRWYVLKQVHHVPCSYYSLGDKIGDTEAYYAET